MRSSPSRSKNRQNLHRNQRYCVPRRYEQEQVVPHRQGRKERRRTNGWCRPDAHHPRALKAGGFDRNMNGGVDEAVVGEVTKASYHKTEAGYDVRYKAVVSRSELFQALESGMWLRPGYGVSIGGYGVPIKADEDGMVFDMDFKFDHSPLSTSPHTSARTLRRPFAFPSPRFTRRRRGFRDR